MRCQFEGCGYETDTDIPVGSTVAEKLEMMRIHIRARHEAPAGGPPVAAARME